MMPLLTWKGVAITLVVVILICVVSAVIGGNKEQLQRETNWATTTLAPEELENTVFLGVAVEPGNEIEAAHTVFSALNSAKWPQLIHVGVLLYTTDISSSNKNKNPLDAYFKSFRAQYERVCASKKAKSFAANIRVHHVYKKHRGNSVSRFLLLERLYDQEKYVCFVQPVVRFHDRWDAVARVSLEQAEAMDDTKTFSHVVLTCEPGEVNTYGRPTYPTVVMSQRGGVGPRWPCVVGQVFSKEPARPYEAVLWSDAWSFSVACAFRRDAVPDNTMSRCDETDQLVTTVLLLSHGWKIYSPIGPVVYLDTIAPNSDPRPLPHPSQKSSDVIRALVLLQNDRCKACGKPLDRHPSNHQFEASHGGKIPKSRLGTVVGFESIRSRLKECWIDAITAEGSVSRGIVSDPTPADEILAKGGLI